MHRNKLLNLLASNRRCGEFRAEATEAGNTIYLYDSIVASEAEAAWWGGVAADTFVRALRGMTGDVALRINCPGGDVFAARAMAQAIRDYPGTVTAYVDGYAASAASFITSVASRTVMAEGAFLMIHKAWTIGMGNADDLAATAQLLSKIDTTIADTYEGAAKKRGVACSAAEFTTLMAAETWLTGREAIDYGLADELAAGGPQSSHAWDLSAYVNAPRNTSLTVEVTVAFQEDNASEDTGETPNPGEQGDPLTAPDSQIGAMAEQRKRVAVLRSRPPA